MYQRLNTTLLSKIDRFYNLKADLKELPPPMKHPATGQPVGKSDLTAIFPELFVEQEFSCQPEIDIGRELEEAFLLFRPTPLIYARALKDYLDTPAEIFFKYEGFGPAGSHKINTALVQAYLAKKSGKEMLVTETGAGQWGSALAFACKKFELQLRVYMVRVSFQQKPGRKQLIESLGAEIYPSPSEQTETGKKYLRQNREHCGSLGIAISEAIETVIQNNKSSYALGSVLDAVLLHQTIVGQEVQQQLKTVGVEPDLLVGCVGGGSNFAGLTFPFIRETLVNNKNYQFLAVEPQSCPTLTAGKLDYDFGDSAALTPLLYMYSLGKDFVPPAIHAGGLRYHGMAPLVSWLVHKGIVRARAVEQKAVFQAGRLFYQLEGFLPAPESAHAIAAVIEEALQARKQKQKKVIVFNLSGHGFLDLAAYSENGGSLEKIKNSCAKGQIV